MIIVQASKGGTGSTFIANALYGFLKPNDPIEFDKKYDLNLIVVYGDE